MGALYEAAVSAGQRAATSGGAARRAAARRDGRRRGCRDATLLREEQLPVALHRGVRRDQLGGLVDLAHAGVRHLAAEVGRHARCLTWKPRHRCRRGLSGGDARRVR
jgi:hypothetical protein